MKNGNLHYLQRMEDTERKDHHIFGPKVPLSSPPFLKMSFYVLDGFIIAHYVMKISYFYNSF